MLLLLMQKLYETLSFGFVHLYTPNRTQKFLSEPFVSRAPTEIHYNEWSVFRKDVNEQIVWKNESGV